ncbi:MAG: MBL fold metallo-hydrolase [Pseudomonadota bacterium]
MPDRLPPPRQLGPRLWRLGTRHQPSFLVRGAGQAAIFEVGVTMSAAATLAQLDALGVAREEVGPVIIAHAHADHSFGAVTLLAGLPRAELRITAGGQAALARPSLAARFRGEDGYTSAVIAQREGLDLNPPRPAVGPRRLAWRALEAGDSLDVGGVAMRFLASDGHVPDGLMAWLPEDGALLASDSAGFLDNGRPGFPLCFVSWDQYMTTLEVAAALEPAVLGLGHQEEISGPAVEEYLAATAQHLEAERRWLRERLAACPDPDQVARDYFGRWYHHDLTIFSAEGIWACCRLLARRSLETGAEC